MLRDIGSGGSSSFTESLVLRYIPPSTYSKLLFISSKKMTIRRTLDVLQSRQSFPPGRRPDSLGKLSSKSNDWLSSPDVNHGSRSTDFAQCERRQASPGRTSGGSRGRSPKSKPDEYPFDICRPENAGLVKLKKPLLLLNRERKKELGQREVIPQIQRLRSGMVLLKTFIGLTTQVEIVSKCHELGIGRGGFYRPGYQDGAKLNLQMMCLGKNWDPESRLYEERRRFDDARAPEIPVEFKKLVDEVLHASHVFLRQSAKHVDELPLMSPDICIVNFYSHSGRLGLHQDIDESRESIEKGLPVVSFSIGDTAEFLYGNGRDADGAKKVLLESGDVLIFGGKSRLIYHGVSCIKPNSSPEQLTDEGKLRPGRLNLTFRQY